MSLKVSGKIHLDTRYIGSSQKQSTRTEKKRLQEWVCDDQQVFVWWNIDGADFDSAIGTFDPDLSWQKRHPPHSSSGVSLVFSLSKNAIHPPTPFDQMCTLWRRTYRDQWCVYTDRRICSSKTQYVAVGAGRAPVTGLCSCWLLFIPTAAAGQ